VGVIVGGRTSHCTLVSFPSLEAKPINFPRERVDLYLTKCHLPLQLIEKMRNRTVSDENKDTLVNINNPLATYNKTAI
jgi:hypothetical protein